MKLVADAGGEGEVSSARLSLGRLIVWSEMPLNAGSTDAGELVAAIPC